MFNFCHTLLLWTFASYKKLNTGNFNSNNRHVCSHWCNYYYYYYYYYFLIQLKRFHFYNLGVSHCFLWKKTRYKWSLFCRTHTKKLRTKNFKYFLKALIECWNVQIIVGYHPTLQTSSQVSRIFAILQSYMHRQTNVFA